MSNSAYRTGVNGKSTDIDELFPGGSTGELRWESGKEYVLVKVVSVGIADGVGGYCTGTDNTVSVTASLGTGNRCVCVNNTGETVAVGYYFWGLKKGLGYAAATAGDDWAAGEELTSGISTWLGSTGPAVTEFSHGVALSVSDNVTIANNSVLWDM